MSALCKDCWSGEDYFITKQKIADVLARESDKLAIAKSKMEACVKKCADCIKKNLDVDISLCRNFNCKNLFERMSTKKTVNELTKRLSLDW